MKKLLFLLLLLPFLAGAQIPVPRSPITIAPEDANLYVTFVLKLPSFADTTHANTYIGHDSVGILFYNLADSNVYVRDLGLGHHRWKLIGSGGAGAVSSVFGRTGAVVATAADYTSYYPLLSGSYSNPSWINTIAASKISSPGSLTAGSSKITFPSGTPSTALLDPVTIDVVEANFNLANLGGLLGIAQINASGVPSSTTFLRGDGTWASASGGTTYTADETSIHLASTVFGVKSTWVGQTSLTTLGTITTGTWNATPITNTYLANMSGHTYKGNNTGSPASPADITSTQLTADLNLFSSSLQGLTPSSGGGITNYLRADGSWAAPSGSSITSPNSTITVGGSTTIDVTHPNTRPTSTVSSPTSFSFVAGDYIEAIWVDPTSTTVNFQIGSTTGTGTGSDYDLIPTQNLATGSLNNFVINKRITGSVTYYFQNISSSTVITILKQQ